MPSAITGLTAVDRAGPVVMSTLQITAEWVGAYA